MTSGLGGLLLGLLLFSVLREKLFVLLKTFAGRLVTADDFSLVLSLSADTGLSDEALDLG